MNKVPHVHAELIKAWADGAEIEYQSHQDNMWYLAPSPVWHANTLYRVKPERVYPKSTLGYTALCQIVNDAHNLQNQGTSEGTATIIARLAADAAVKQYIIETSS